MELPLYITYFTPVIILGAVAYFYLIQKKSQSIQLRLFFFGSLGWSIVAATIMFPLLLILESSSEKRYLEIFDTSGDDHRTILFWLLFVFALLSEIVRSQIVKTQKSVFTSDMNLLKFGLWWGIVEFLSRFLFFFKSFSNHYWVTIYLLIYIILLNQGLSLIIIRVNENTKYIMFAACMRFFIEMTIFGAFGHFYSSETRFERLSFVMVNFMLIVALSIKTRKFSFQTPNPA